MFGCLRANKVAGSEEEKIEDARKFPSKTTLVLSHLAGKQEFKMKMKLDRSTYLCKRKLIAREIYRSFLPDL